MNLGQLFAFLDHGVCFDAYNLGTDWPVDDLAHLLQHFSKTSTFLHDQGGIGCHAVEQSEAGGFLDFLHVGGIEINLHDCPFPHQETVDGYRFYLLIGYSMRNSIVVQLNQFKSLTDGTLNVRIFLNLDSLHFITEKM